MPDDDILHQDDVEAVIDQVIEAGIGADQAAIANLVAITGGESPTEAEHNAVITAVNAILVRLRVADIILP